MPNIFSTIFQRRTNYSPLLSLLKTSLSLQTATTLHFLSHNAATRASSPWKKGQKMSEMRPKTSHVLKKNSHVFPKMSEKIWKISHVFQETSDVFLLSLEEIKRKLRCLSSTPRKQESKVVNQQILKCYSHARTPTRITAIFVFLLSQPSQKFL